VRLSVRPPEPVLSRVVARLPDPKHATTRKLGKQQVSARLPNAPMSAACFLERMNRDKVLQDNVLPNHQVDLRFALCTSSVKLQNAKSHDG
jgi:hypothetical protein